MWTVSPATKRTFAITYQITSFNHNKQYLTILSHLTWRLRFWHRCFWFWNIFSLLSFCFPTYNNCHIHLSQKSNKNMTHVIFDIINNKKCENCYAILSYVSANLLKTFLAQPFFSLQTILCNDNSAIFILHVFRYLSPCTKTDDISSKLTNLVVVFPTWWLSLLWPSD